MMRSPTKINKPGKPNIAIELTVYKFNGINKLSAFIMMLNPYNIAREKTVRLIIFINIFIYINK